MLSCSLHRWTHTNLYTLCTHTHACAHMNSWSFQQFDTRLLTIVCWFRIESDTHNREQVKISGFLKSWSIVSSYSVCMYACLCELSNAKTYMGVLWCSFRQWTFISWGNSLSTDSNSDHSLAWKMKSQNLLKQSTIVIQCWRLEVKWKPEQNDRNLRGTQFPQLPPKGVMK